MKKKLRMIAFALAACMILTAACPMLPAGVGNSSTVEAASKNSKITVTTKDDSIFLQIGKSKKATGFYQLPQNIKSSDGKTLVHKGIYYLYLGRISNYDKNKVVKTLKKVNRKGKIVSSKTYMLNVKNPKTKVKKGVVRISSSTRLFTGTYKGIKYRNGKAKKQSQSKGKKNSKAGQMSLGDASISAAKKTPAKVKTNEPQVVDLVFYRNKQKQSGYTGWLKLGKKLYYIRRGKALHSGYYALKGYNCQSQKFNYLFDDDGTVVTNRFGISKKVYNALLKQKLKFEINLSSHTFTIYMKDSKTGYYSVPLKSFVCATSRHYNGTPTGTYTLNKGHHHRWFIYRRSNPYHYYQYAVKVGNTNILIHSNMYYSTNNRRLVKKYYNLFGHNITTHCIRVQAVNAKMIYQIALKNKNAIKVKVYRSKTNPGPFGKITLKDTTGKTKKNYDPTDPNIVKDAYKIY